MNNIDSQQEKKQQLQSDIRKLRNSLCELPEPVVCPGFVVVSGLPGTGKSHFCHMLAEKSSFCIMETDALRRILFEFPVHSTEESTRLFTACHALIEQLLQDGVPIIFDATNISEHHREYLYAIGERTDSKLVLVRVVAPAEVVYERLERRSSGVADGKDKSGANWDVYSRMEPRLEKINRSHLVVDTSRDIVPVVDKIIRIIKH
jgi:predicted kinase